MAIREYFDNGTDHTHLVGWQTKPELPTVQEVMGTDQVGDDFTLTVNKISGPWPSTDLYLKTHYNLLREDAVAPLRDAIATFRQRPGMTDNNNLVIYERVRRNFTCES
jgi:helicase required for RNAi-mediated heterochromatin assembly 1